jgi:hypothetical protein
MVYYYEDRIIRRFETRDNSMRVTSVRMNSVLRQDTLQLPVWSLVYFGSYIELDH